MAKIVDIPVSSLQAAGDGVLTPRAEAALLVTDPQQWAFSARASFEVPGLAESSRAIRVGVEVERGILGVGWVVPDGSDWVTRTSASAGSGLQELMLELPAGTEGGSLVFDNWTQGGRSAQGVIHRIEIVEIEKPAVLSRKRKAARAQEADEQARAAAAAEEGGDREAAISGYRAALSVDPSHVQARAGLGRLRFVQPEQPFLDEMRRRVALDICQVTVEVRNPCNYRCFYCVAAGHNDVPVQRFDLERIELAYAQIHARVIASTLECGGGEPTIHPQFPELLRLLSTYGAVDFPSNNSQNPERWLPRDLARRILIRSALHPESEPNIDRYLGYARYLLDAGVTFQTTYIAHPTRMAKIPEYQELFAKHDVRFVPVAFIGEYEGKRYPHAYTDEEQQMLGLKEESRYWLHKIEPHVTRIRNYRGIPCIAGYRSIYVTKDGTLRRCMYDQREVLETPLTAPRACEVKHCGCGMYLDKLNSVESIDVYNYWSRKTGSEQLPEDWMAPLARALGYTEPSEAMAVEHIRMYDSLMEAYGKDEFPE